MEGAGLEGRIQPGAEGDAAPPSRDLSLGSREGDLWSRLPAGAVLASSGQRGQDRVWLLCLPVGGGLLRTPA